MTTACRRAFVFELRLKCGRRQATPLQLVIRRTTCRGAARRRPEPSHCRLKPETCHVGGKAAKWSLAPKARRENQNSQSLVFDLLTNKTSIDKS